MFFRQMAIMYESREGKMLLAGAVLLLVGVSGILLGLRGAMGILSVLIVGGGFVLLLVGFIRGGEIFTLLEYVWVTTLEGNGLKVELYVRTTRKIGNVKSFTAAVTESCQKYSGQYTREYLLDRQQSHEEALTRYLRNEIPPILTDGTQLWDFTASIKQILDLPPTESLPISASNVALQSETA